ncbi:hypothetical protein Bpfe_010876 [Biomphalaria pfeifferi]|uniref:Uncharacterized protein n=1 Tax=Biomphalaria pfeifferi TaxID=112525 RepID=A0AAD8BT30_BIOPF|nr:hypothetical protein Bpfe_010876 [Biomphalaria pfeifferi]
MEVVAITVVSRAAVLRRQVSGRFPWTSRDTVVGPQVVAAIAVTFLALKVIPDRLAHNTVTDGAPIPSASITTVCAATVLTR